MFASRAVLGLLVCCLTAMPSLSAAVIAQEKAMGLIHAWAAAVFDKPEIVLVSIKALGAHGATVQLKVSNLKYLTGAGEGDDLFTGPAQARFVEYSDGTWGMTQFVLNPGPHPLVSWEDLHITEETVQHSSRPPQASAMEKTQNESSAIWHLKAVASAENQFHQSSNRYGDIAELTKAGLLPKEFGWPAYNGYTFALKINGPASYVATAVPIAIGKTGQRGFLCDRKGVIHFSKTGIIPAETDPVVQ